MQARAAGGHAMGAARDLRGAAQHERNRVVPAQCPLLRALEKLFANGTGAVNSLASGRFRRRSKSGDRFDSDAQVSDFESDLVSVAPDGWSSTLSARVGRQAASLGGAGWGAVGVTRRPVGDPRMRMDFEGRSDLVTSSRGNDARVSWHVRTRGRSCGCSSGRTGGLHDGSARARAG